MKKTIGKWLSLMLVAILVAGALPADAYGVVAKELTDSAEEIILEEDTELAEEGIVDS